MTAAARWAWLLAALCAVMTILDTAVVATSISLMSSDSIGFHGWPLVNAASLGSSVLGAVIVSSYPRHPIGWLLTVIGFTSAVSLLAESYSIWVVDEGGPGSTLAAEIAGMVAGICGGPLALAALAIVFVIVPNGEFASPRWRWVAWLAIAGHVLFVIGVLLIGPEGSMNRDDEGVGNPTAEIFVSVGILLIAAVIIASVWGLAIRLRGAEGEVRQQLRVVAFGATCVGASFVLLIAGQLISREQAWWSSVPLFAAYAVLMGCIAIAVLRYRLSDVDVIVSSALVVAVATAFAGLGYVAVVVVISLLIGSRDVGFWPSLVATALVAMAFQPLRRWIVRFADRLAYGDRAVPYDALADFSRRLGESPAPDLLLPALAEASAQATGARLVLVELLTESGPARAVSWPSNGASGADDQAPAMTVGVADRVGELGTIAVYLRPGRNVREQERQLVVDLAEQAALGFRNARLEVELASHVEALDRHTDELAASRRRVIGAADDERRRLEAAITREVIPELRTLDSSLRSMQQGSVDPAAVEGLIAHATEALERLRELTRGIYPTMLTRAGLGPALISYFARNDRPSVLEVDESATGRRFATRVETAAFFCCTQVAGDPGEDVRIRLAVRDEWLVVDIDGVNIGSADRPAMTDRAEICGGSIDFDPDTAGGRPVIRLRLPAAPVSQAFDVASVHS